MTKRYAILQKKLKELESNFNLIHTFHPDTATYDILSHSIEQQLEFLNHLVAMEIASCPSKPRHLHHIARRLNGFETAFHHIDDCHTLPDAAVQGIINDVDSVCSCNESSLSNDDGKATSQVRDLGTSPVNYDVPSEDSPVVEMEEKGVEEKEEGLEVDGHYEEEGIWGMSGKFFGVLGCGIMIGAVCMGLVMERFSGRFLVIEPLGFLTPT